MYLSLLDPCWSMFTARQVNKQKISIDQWSFVIILFKYPKYFVIKMAKQNDYCDPQGLQFWTILVTWKVQGLLHCAPLPHSGNAHWCLPLPSKRKVPNTIRKYHIRRNWDISDYIWSSAPGWNFSCSPDWFIDNCLYNQMWIYFKSISKN